MADLFSVTAPLALRLPDGSSKLIAECFPHPEGLLYLDIFWHRSTPDQAAHLVRGELTGDGPWRIGDCVIRVLGCQGTDPDLQPAFTRWQDYLQRFGPTQYPPADQIREIARRLGAMV
jgi:hypothetical protein